MTITELIQKVGPENCQVQYIHEAMANIQKTKHGSLITFCTTALSPNDVAAGSGKIGMVIWFDRERWSKAKPHA